MNLKSVITSSNPARLSEEHGTSLQQLMEADKHHLGVGGEENVGGGGVGEDRRGVDGESNEKKADDSEDQVARKRDEKENAESRAGAGRMGNKALNIGHEAETRRVLAEKNQQKV